MIFNRHQTLNRVLKRTLKNVIDSAHLPTNNQLRLIILSYKSSYTPKIRT